MRFIISFLLCSFACIAVPAFPVQMRMYPAVTRDDGRTFIFSDHLSEVGFFYFVDGGVSRAELKDMTFSIEFPRQVKIHSAAVIEGWREGPKIYNFVKVESKRDGYFRYLLPLPGFVNAKLSTKILSFTGFYTMVYLEPDPASAPREFQLFWEISGPQGKISGKQSFECIKFAPALRKPSRFEFWSSSGTRYADSVELDNQIAVFQGIGIHTVDPGKNIYVSDLFTRWRTGGFVLYDSSLSKFIFNFNRTAVNGYPDDVFHVNIGGIHTANSQKYRNSPYCPGTFYDLKSPVFRKTLDYVKQQAMRGVKYFYSDHEVDIYGMCYCHRCLAEFATFAGIRQEDLFKLKPYEIARKYPEEWYRFRCHQSGRFINALRCELNKNGLKDVKLGLNGAICYHTRRIKDLGYGRALFADDPRLYDDMVDFHNYDSLSGGILDAVLVDTIIDSLKKPVYARTMSNYCYGWAPAHCFQRYEKSKTDGVAAGYDQRAEMQTLSILNLAATGVKGVELLTGGNSDARVTNGIARAAEIVADYEDVWLDGKRVENSQEIYDLSNKNSPYYHDKRFIAGKIWGMYFKGAGPLMYRVHHYRNTLTFAAFNWDMMQKQKLLWRPHGLNGKSFYLWDKSHSVLFLNWRNSPVWTLEDLRQGVILETPPLFFSIVTLTDRMPDKVLLKKKLEQPPNGDLPRYNLYHYRLNENLEDYGLSWAVEATLKDMKGRGFIPADIPEEK